MVYLFELPSLGSKDQGVPHQLCLSSTSNIAASSRVDRRVHPFRPATQETMGQEINW